MRAVRGVVAPAELFLRHSQAVNAARPLLGVDFGTSRTGVAVWFPSEGVCRPLATLRVNVASRTPADVQMATALMKHVVDNDVFGAIVGWPRALRGESTHSNRLVLRFVESLRLASVKSPLQIALWDERLSSVAARLALGGGEYVKLTAKEKQREHEVAAQLVLEDFLAKVNPTVKVPASQM